MRGRPPPLSIVPQIAVKKTWLPQTMVCSFLESYQASNILVEDIWDLSMRLLMPNYLYNITSQDARVKTEHQICPSKPIDLSKAGTLDLAISREWNSWPLCGHPRLYHRVCLEQQWLLMTSCLSSQLGLVAFGRRSGLCPHVSFGWALMITWGTFPQKQKQSCWLVSRVGQWPTGKDAGCDLKHQEWARETLLSENSWESLGEKNRDLWWGIWNSGQR